MFHVNLQAVEIPFTEDVLESAIGSFSNAGVVWLLFEEEGARQGKKEREKEVCGCVKGKERDRQTESERESG